LLLRPHSEARQHYIPFQPTALVLGFQREMTMIETTNETPRPRAKRGFAVMDPTRVREIASMGGRTAHANGRAHEFTSEEARAAGKKRHQRRAESAPSAT
jgi:general stress protein YciG